MMIARARTFAPPPLCGMCTVPCCVPASAAFPCHFFCSPVAHLSLALAFARSGAREQKEIIFPINVIAGLFEKNTSRAAALARKVHICAIACARRKFSSAHARASAGLSYVGECALEVSLASKRFLFWGLCIFF